MIDEHLKKLIKECLFEFLADQMPLIRSGLVLDKDGFDQFGFFHEPDEIEERGACDSESAQEKENIHSLSPQSDSLMLLSDFCKKYDFNFRTIQKYLCQKKWELDQFSCKINRLWFVQEKEVAELMKTHYKKCPRKPLSLTFSNEQSDK